MKTILLLLLPLFGFSQVKLEPQKLFDDKIQVSVPVELKKTNNPLAGQNRDIIFASRDRNIILSISYTPEKLALNQFNAYQRFLITGLKEDFPDIVIAHAGVVEKNERQIGFINCEQLINGKKVNSSICFTSLEGRLFKTTLEYASIHQAE